MAAEPPRSPAGKENLMRIWFAAIGMIATFAFAAAAAEFEKGLGALLRGDFPTATAWFRRVAEQDGAGAQYYLGLMHDGGIGVPQNGG